MYWVAAAVIILVLILLWAMKPKQEHIVPTYNVTFEQSLQDRSTDYLYDLGIQKGLTAADYALEQNILEKQRVNSNP